MSKGERRFLRRLEARRRDERERLAALEKFGASADDRKEDRRKPKPVDENERILKEMGITDRRRVQRRSGGSW